MPKESALKLESVKLLLPEELPFEKGTGLANQDACSRLMFQLLIERALPSYVYEEEFEDESVL
ncbi:hypothetical protein KJ596_03800 [Patescibacteria group bacterium]|nr:hypothetical protein [Patescibacteria group bacterium]MBU1868399.1 hypothetical protein [Patescibacteria group bacterium]